MKITVRNLRGESCTIEGDEDCDFSIFINKVPIENYTEERKKDIIVVHRGKKYSLETKWGDTLKNGDVVHIYKKLNKYELDELYNQDESYNQDELYNQDNLKIKKCVSVGTQTPENIEIHSGGEKNNQNNKNEKIQIAMKNIMIQTTIVYVAFQITRYLYSKISC